MTTKMLDQVLTVLAYKAGLEYENIAWSNREAYRLALTFAKAGFSVDVLDEQGNEVIEDEI